jgi:hypothetical protein
VPLRTMPKLSITNRKLEYGVDVDEIFWVQEGILRREEVRQSSDEQLVLDILIDILVDPIPDTGTRHRDDYYDYRDTGTGPTKESAAVNRAIAIYGPDRLADDFMYTYDAIRSALADAGQKFARLVRAGSGGRSPRYFHAVFMAFYELMFKERLRLRDPGGAAAALVNVAPRMQVPGGGGDWTKGKKRSSFDTVKGLLRSSFEGPIAGDDVGRFGYAAQFEVVLGNALVEQQLFDCKQGLYTLQAPRVFDDGSFTKVLRSLSAMANMGRDLTGYVVVGIADNERAAETVQRLDGVQAEVYRGFRIVGIDRETTLAGKSLNDYWHWIMQRLESSDLDAKIAKQVKADARLVSYRTKAVMLLKVLGGAEPNFFVSELYERRGSDTCKVEQKDYMRVYARFARDL